MANEFVRNLLMEQRRRAVGSIMSHAERELFPSLTPKQRQEFRDKVLASVGVYHDTCLDILKASVDDGIVPNGVLLEKLAELHQAVEAIAPGRPSRAG